ncbi:MAG: transaldolase family protein [Mariniphaga sp.]
MDNALREKIKRFIAEGINEKPIEARPDSFWNKLKAVGTELWLDTGDMKEAENIWSAEMSALTTNNTLVNKEIQKGIYDDVVYEAAKLVKELPLQQQIIEIAFILNARHGLRLAKRFGGLVSVELHTGIAHDIEATVDYGKRYFDISPNQFLIKVPFTAAGLIAARKLREQGVKINFTLEFSARQNILVALIAKPNYLNVFLGRVGAYFSDNGLGSGSGAGERALLESQRWVTHFSKNLAEPIRLIAASLRNYRQLVDLAGVDVFTMPVQVAAEGKANLSGSFKSQVEEIYQVDLKQEAMKFFPEKLWEVTEKELELAKNIDQNIPHNGNELIERAHKAGSGDMFPYLDDSDRMQIHKDGKIPRHEHWADRIISGELAIDTLLNLSGLASFAEDQKRLDDRIKKIID